MLCYELPALLCLPPTSSSSLLLEKTQRCLNGPCGPAMHKGRDCEQPLLARGASSSPSRAAKPGVLVGLGRSGAGAESSVALKVVGLGWVPVPLQDPEECGEPGGQGSTRSC